ncbi:hypothetical protein N5W20_00340 [Candidatus Kirkpatrickella diaphorinae]|uniref:NfeD-like C-terminal domain-containing protein n=1 Tax=Candidatus Kirkpatrickella diaphorinae TaxID=2984322 RepID=A0ABY6GJ83_9PROT|nr:hypothetical protein [Candidatus Kirkpatrickella diaphorinae]UYH51372.1 hypothetical protein N5W20_00340 [Candidatus Kirkpatrickella diaphorinae]
MNLENPNPGPSRALTGLVIVMGVLIIIGFAALVSVIISRHLRPEVATPLEVRRALLHVTGQSRITKIVPRANGDVIIEISGQNGDQRVAVWEPSSGRIAAELELVPTP